MGAFVKDSPFKDIKEYSEYPFSHLYDNGRLLGKAITDNWQYRVLCNRIQSGVLCKAKLADEYKIFSVSALMFTKGDYDTKPLTITRDFTAKNAKEAEKKMLCIEFNNKLLSTGIEHEYVFPDESGIVKIKAVEKSD